jgi:hypothetical protein
MSSSSSRPLSVSDMPEFSVIKEMVGHRYQLVGKERGVFIQNDLARELDVNPSIITLWKNGVYKSLETMWKFWRWAAVGKWDRHDPKEYPIEIPGDIDALRLWAERNTWSAYEKAQKSKKAGLSKGKKSFVPGGGGNYNVTGKGFGPKVKAVRKSAGVFDKGTVAVHQGHQGETSRSTVVKQKTYGLGAHSIVLGFKSTRFIDDIGAGTGLDDDWFGIKNQLRQLSYKLKRASGADGYENAEVGTKRVESEQRVKLLKSISSGNVLPKYNIVKKMFFRKFDRLNLESYVTQIEIAKNFGVSPSILSQWKNGIYRREEFTQKVFEWAGGHDALKELCVEEGLFMEDDLGEGEEILKDGQKQTSFEIKPEASTSINPNKRSRDESIDQHPLIDPEMSGKNNNQDTHEELVHLKSKEDIISLSESSSSISQSVTSLVVPSAVTPSLVVLPSLPLVALPNENSAPVSQPSYSFYFENSEHLHIAETTISAYAPIFSDSDSVVLSTALLGMKTKAKIAQGFIHAAHVVNQMRAASSSKSSTPSRILHMSVPLMVRSYNQGPLLMDETDLILEQISKTEPIVYSSAVSASTDVSTDAPISTSVPASTDVPTSTAVQASVSLSEEDMSGEGVKVKASNSEFGLIPIEDVLGMRYVRSQKKTVVKLRIGSGNKKGSKEGGGGGGGGPKAATKAVEVPSVPAADSSDTKDSPDRSKTSSSASPGPVGSREYLVRFVAGLPYNEVPGISRLFQIYEPKIDDRFDSGIFDDSDVPNPKRSKISVASTEAQIQSQIQSQSQIETVTETQSSSLPVMATVEVLDGKSKSDLVSIAGAEIIPVPSTGGAPTGIMSRSTKHWGDVAGYLLQILRHRRELAYKGVETKSTELALCTFPSSVDKMKSDAEIDRITAALKEAKDLAKLSDDTLTKIRAHVLHSARVKQCEGLISLGLAMWVPESAIVAPSHIINLYKLRKKAGILPTDDDGQRNVNPDSSFTKIMNKYFASCTTATSIQGVYAVASNYATLLSEAVAKEPKNEEDDENSKTSSKNNPDSIDAYEKASFYEKTLRSRIADTEALALASSAASASTLAKHASDFRSLSFSEYAIQLESDIKRSLLHSVRGPQGGQNAFFAFACKYLLPSLAQQEELMRREGNPGWGKLMLEAAETTFIQSPVMTTYTVTAFKGMTRGGIGGIAGIGGRPRMPLKAKMHGRPRKYDKMDIKVDESLHDIENDVSGAFERISKSLHGVEVTVQKIVDLRAAHRNSATQTIASKKRALILIPTQSATKLEPAITATLSSQLEPAVTTPLPTAIATLIPLAASPVPSDSIAALFPSSVPSVIVAVDDDPMSSNKSSTAAAAAAAAAPPPPPSSSSQEVQANEALHDALHALLQDGELSESDALLEGEDHRTTSSSTGRQIKKLKLDSDSPVIKTTQEELFTSSMRFRHKSIKIDGTTDIMHAIFDEKEKKFRDETTNTLHDNPTAFGEFHNSRLQKEGLLRKTLIKCTGWKEVTYFCEKNNAWVPIKELRGKPKHEKREPERDSSILKLKKPAINFFNSSMRFKHDAFLIDGSIDTMYAIFDEKEKKFRDETTNTHHDSATAFGEFHNSRLQKEGLLRRSNIKCSAWQEVLYLDEKDTTWKMIDFLRQVKQAELANSMIDDEQEDAAGAINDGENSDHEAEPTMKRKKKSKRSTIDNSRASRLAADQDVQLNEFEAQINASIPPRKRLRQVIDEIDATEAVKSDFVRSIPEWDITPPLSYPQRPLSSVEKNVILMTSICGGVRPLLSSSDAIITPVVGSDLVSYDPLAPVLDQFPTMSFFPSSASNNQANYRIKNESRRKGATRFFWLQRALKLERDRREEALLSLSYAKSSEESTLALGTTTTTTTTTLTSSSIVSGKKTDVSNTAMTTTTRLLPLLENSIDKRPVGGHVGNIALGTYGRWLLEKHSSVLPTRKVQHDNDCLTSWRQFSQSSQSGKRISTNSNMDLEKREKLDKPLPVLFQSQVDLDIPSLHLFEKSFSRPARGDGGYGIGIGGLCPTSLPSSASPGWNDYRLSAATAGSTLAAAQAVDERIRAEGGDTNGLSDFGGTGSVAIRAMLLDPPKGLFGIEPIETAPYEGVAGTASEVAFVALVRGAKDVISYDRARLTQDQYEARCKEHILAHGGQVLTETATTETATTETATTEIATTETATTETATTQLEDVNTQMEVSSSSSLSASASSDIAAAGVDVKKPRSNNFGLSTQVFSSLTAKRHAKGGFLLRTQVLKRLSRPSKVLVLRDTPKPLPGQPLLWNVSERLGLSSDICPPPLAFSTGLRSTILMGLSPKIGKHHLIVDSKETVEDQVVGDNEEEDEGNAEAEAEEDLEGEEEEEVDAEDAEAEAEEELEEDLEEEEPGEEEHAEDEGGGEEEEEEEEVKVKMLKEKKL